MDQQDHGPDKPQAPAGGKQPARGKLRAEQQSANDSNWGLGSASALDNLRRHDYRGRRSRVVETDDEPVPERPLSE
jgi:hypothetical protein